MFTTSHCTQNIFSRDLAVCTASGLARRVNDWIRGEHNNCMLTNIFFFMTFESENIAVVLRARQRGIGSVATRVDQKKSRSDNFVCSLRKCKEKKSM
jgi:hypothetical protein